METRQIEKIDPAVRQDRLNQIKRQQEWPAMKAFLQQHVSADEIARRERENAILAAKLQAGPRKLCPELQAKFDEIKQKYSKVALPQSEAEYALLGIEPGATKREIKNAYRRQARKLHPDAGGDEAAFKRMYAAYRHLLSITKE